MSLLAVVLILIFWAVYATITKLTPQDPPIENETRFHPAGRKTPPRRNAQISGKRKGKIEKNIYKKAPLCYTYILI